MPFFRDVLLTSLPLRLHAAARLRALEWPQWFPYESLGEPFLGQLAEAALHPATLLYAFCSPMVALRLDLALAYAVAIAGAWAAARAFGLGPLAAALGGLTFGLSGYLTSLSANLAYLWGAAALPWIAAAARHIATSDRPARATAAAALATGSCLLSGDAHAAGLGALALAIIVGLERPRRLGWAALAVALGAALAAVELVPGAHVYAESSRAQWQNAAFLSRFHALHPDRLLELFVPRAVPRWVGELVAQNRWSENGRWAESIFLGSGALALAAFGALEGGRRALQAGLCALFGLWLALGRHGGLELWLRELFPPLRALRFPEKDLALCALGVALLAALGAEALRRTASRRAPLALTAAALVCGLLALSEPSADSHIWMSLYGQGLAGGGLAHEAREALAASLSAGLQVAAATLAVCALAALLAARSWAGAALLAAAVAAELVWASQSALPTVPPEALTREPELCRAAREAATGPAGPRVLVDAARWPRYEGPESGRRWVERTRELLLPDASAICGVAARGPAFNLPAEPAQVTSLLGLPCAAPALCALFGFDLAVRDELRAGERLLQRLPAALGGHLLVAQPAAPRAFAGEPRFVPSLAEAEALVRADPPLAARAPVLIGPALAQAAPGGGPLAAQVRIVSFAPERVVLEAELSGPAAVVLNDAFAPGWTASVDAQPAQAFRANALVRAVLAPAGRHRIEWRFRAPGLSAGLLLSLVSALACLALLWRRSAIRIAT